MTFLFTTIEIASDESREEREEKGLCTISLKGLFQTLHIIAASRLSSHDMALDLIIYPTCRYVRNDFFHAQVECKLSSLQEIIATSTTSLGRKFGPV